MNKASGKTPGRQPVNVDKIIADMKSRNLAVRIKAMSIAIDIKDQSFIEQLISGLGDKNEEVRACAALALGGYEENLVLDHLCRALSDKSPVVRSSVIEAMATIAGSNAHHAVISALDDSELSVRGSAIRVLAASGDAEDVKVLLDRAADYNKIERQLIANSLSESDSESIHAFMKDAAEHQDFGVIVAAHRYFLKYGGITDEVLIQALYAEKESPVESSMAESFRCSDIPKLKQAGESYLGEYVWPVTQNLSEHQLKLVEEMKRLTKRTD
jgi:HEAT repeat protein